MQKFGPLQHPLAGFSPNSAFVSPASFCFVFFGGGGGSPNLSSFFGILKFLLIGSSSKISEPYEKHFLDIFESCPFSGENRIN